LIPAKTCDAGIKNDLIYEGILSMAEPLQPLFHCGVMIED
jgi:hypothetical protein